MQLHKFIASLFCHLKCFFIVLYTIFQLNFVFHYKRPILLKLFDILNLWETAYLTKCVAYSKTSEFEGGLGNVNHPPHQSP